MSVTHYVTATGEVPCGKVNYREDFTSAEGDAVPVDCPACLQGIDQPDDSTVPAPATPKGEYGSVLHLLEEQRRTLEEVEALRRDLAVVVEFVNVLKGMGESLANAKGMQANMLRNMIPGLDQLGGQ